MEFNRRSPLFTRVVILTATTFLLGYIASGKSNTILALALLSTIVFQVAQLIKPVEGQSEPNLSSLDPPKFDDVSQTFKTDSADPATRRFYQKLNESIARLRSSRTERDSEYQFFKNIVQHVGIGLLTFKKDGSIQIMNTAAKRLLRITKADTLNDLRAVSDSLVEVFLKLKTGGRELARLKTGDESVQLSVFAIELTMRGEEVKLISMNNIQSELEEKEMEAWQNLVRVLTHEIMNSVTPISSLAGIVEEDLKHRVEKNDLRSFSKEELLDMHLSLATITKRSEGLIHFVKEFRNLTHIPKPRLVTIPVKPLLDELAILHKKELADRAISCLVEVAPENLEIHADKHMIEQVLINLIKNAIQAFEETGEKTIVLRGFMNEKAGPVISVKDNGPGIDPEALEKIFIPFFSTKKTGSGIGLSLSRQIMRQHEGSITVKSTLGEGTEFFLRF
jgi:two-component system, NtrC family, nitrogen regulation sensor histidine kinase NtrY